MLLLGVIQAQAAGAAPALAGSFDLLQSEVLGSSQASVTFGSLGDYVGVYQHLQIRAAIRSTQATQIRMFLMQFNGDSGSNYNSHLLYSDGPGSLNNGTQTSMWWSYGAGASSPTGAYSAIVTDILDPFETTKNTTIRSLGGGPNGYNIVNLVSGLWRNTNALTSITLSAQSSDSYAIGSRFSLYGWKAQ